MSGKRISESDYQNILSKIAKKHGKTAREVEQTMEEGLKGAWEQNEAMQKMFSDLKRPPTLREALPVFIQFINNEDFS